MVFYLGSRFILNYDDSSKNVFIAIQTLFLAALGSGISMSNAPSINPAQEAATKILTVIDE